MTKLYSVADVARKLGVAQSDIHACIKDGTVTPQMIGGRYVLDADDVDTLHDEFENSERDVENGEDEGDQESEHDSDHDSEDE
jgi:hypothetical protein